MSRPQSFVAELQQLLESHGNAVQSQGMAAYMQQQFPFLGIKTPMRRASLMPYFNEAKEFPDSKPLREIARRLWRLPEREFQYAAVDFLLASSRILTPADLEFVRELVVEKSWWDTVDMLASGVVGPLVLQCSDLKEVMDDWSVAANLWIRRTALLHQLRYKEQTDVPRLFGYCLANAGDHEPIDPEGRTDIFFIRKAIGWALREFAKTDRAAVICFVNEHKSRFAPLSVREALKHVRE